MKKMVMVLFVGISMVLLSGCMGKGIENNLSQVRIAKGEEMVKDKTKKQRANDIKERIMELEGLDGAAVVVEGHKALIGLRVKADWVSDSIRLKSEADELAKKTDKGIEGTAITTNDKITSMIERMEREELARIQTFSVFSAKFS